MKLRRIGNSLGTTFSKELLQSAGLSGEEELEVTTAPGEIRIRRARGGVLVEFSRAEAEALAAGETDTKIAQTALVKLRKLIGADK